MGKHSKGRASGLPVPSKLEEIVPEKVYGIDGAMTVFGVRRNQIQRWTISGILKRLPETGEVYRFSGSELLRFARDVLGVQEAAA